MIKHYNRYGKHSKPFLRPPRGRSTADAPKRAGKRSPGPVQSCSRNHVSQKIMHGSSARRTEPVSLWSEAAWDAQLLHELLAAPGPDRAAWGGWSPADPVVPPKCHRAALQCCRRGLPSADKPQPCKLLQQALTACGSWPAKGCRASGGCLLPSRHCPCWGWSAWLHPALHGSPWSPASYGAASRIPGGMRAPGPGRCPVPARRGERQRHLPAAAATHE